MKKIISLVLCTAIFASAFLMTGCGKKKSSPLALGLGIHTSADLKNAKDGQNGGGTATSTAAAVLLEGNTVVRCVLDAAENQLAFTSDGKAIASEDALTKREQGDGYGMKAYGGAKLEWYEQANAFGMLAEGKTVDEIKALVASDGKGTDEVIRAGCTIDVSDFVRAIEKAAANAAPSASSKTDTLKLGAATLRTMQDATAEADGANQTETTFFAATVDPSGTITAAYSDCVQVEFTFNEEGFSQASGQWTVSTKRDSGDAYGMKQYGGADLEWYEQANAFDRACLGKKASGISALLGEDGYGSLELQRAGCTIAVNGFVKAASKI